jgi:hypothetical protein
MIIILKKFKIQVKIRLEMMYRTELLLVRSTLCSNSIIQTRLCKEKECFHFIIFLKKTKQLIIHMALQLNTLMLFNQIWGLSLDCIMILIKIKT